MKHWGTQRTKAPVRMDTFNLITISTLPATHVHIEHRFSPLPVVPHESTFTKTMHKARKAAADQPEPDSNCANVTY
eukprot:1157685-Pelagomonas_calceolata.AAC.4